MKKNSILLIITIALCTFYNCRGQIRVYKVGEQLPELGLQTAFNYKTNKPADFRFSDLKGKLIILDFWGVFCVPCIEGFSKIDSLQKEFKGKVQFMTASNMTQDSIARFFKHHSKIYRPSVPFIYSDKTLAKMFPHTGVPFQVWIDSTGKVIYQASDNELNSKNINRVLNSETGVVRQKIPNVYPNSLFEQKWRKSVQFSSYLVRSNYDDMLHLSKDDHVKGITDGGSVFLLYQRAYNNLTNNEYEFHRAGRTVLIVKDSSRFISPAKGESEWRNKNYFQYQLTVPDGYAGNLYQLMIEDLKRYFNLEVTIEDRPVKCLVLVRTSNVDKLKASGGTQQDTYYPANITSPDMKKERVLINKPFSILSARISSAVEFQIHQPFYDETGYTGLIDFKSTGAVLDHMSLDLLQKDLKRYDLALVEKERNLKVLVIKETEQSHLID